RPLNKIYFYNSERGYVVGERIILRTLDGGKHWEERFIPVVTILNDIFFTDDQHGFAAGFGSTLLTTMDEGDSWQIGDFTNDCVFYSLYFVNQNVGWIAGEQGFNHGVIFKTTDGGQSWNPSLTGNNIPYIYSLTFSNPQNGWVAGDDGAIFHYTTNGGNDTWTREETGTWSNLRGLWAVNDSSAWCVGGDAETIDPGTYGVILSTACGAKGVLASISHPDSEAPRAGMDLQVFPNPAASLTKIRYQLSTGGKVVVKVFTLTGGEGRTLFSGWQSRGKQELEFNCRTLAPGVYAIRIESAGNTAAKKLVVY
ncbi:MAG TPA: YCF48-related protein, partial [Bacteroidales bacterium]|nr:YCF48-related protein [Bacteroidales bacterium]